MTIALEVLAPAKVNLFLELVSRRQDGFHEIETVMAKVGLFDRLVFRRRNDSQLNIRIVKNPGGRNDLIPLDSNNLIWQAIQQLRKLTGEEFGVDVAINKRIPTESGLGGGSSNAAHALMAVNQLFKLRQRAEKLIDIGNRLGSDVGFFFASAVAICRGRGEKVESFASPSAAWFVIVMPKQGFCTAEVYRHVKIVDNRWSSVDTLNSLYAGDIYALGEALRNRLQTSATMLSPWIARIRNEFEGINCSGHQMSGSGASYFGVFATRMAAQRAAKVLRARLPDSTVYCVRQL